MPETRLRASVSVEALLVSVLVIFIMIRIMQVILLGAGEIEATHSANAGARAAIVDRDAAGAARAAAAGNMLEGLSGGEIRFNTAGEHHTITIGQPRRIISDEVEIRSTIKMKHSRSLGGDNEQ